VAAVMTAVTPVSADCRISPKSKMCRRTRSETCERVDPKAQHAGDKFWLLAAPRIRWANRLGHFHSDQTKR
jgi:hypothetical protein